MDNRFITGKAAYDKYGPSDTRSWVGTGPYLFQENVPGQHVVLSKNPNYWGPAVEPDQVLFRSIQDDVARVTSLKNGEVDVIDQVPPTLIPQLGGNARLESVESLLNFFLVLNPIAEPLRDVRVRQAIYYAIDRHALVDNLLSGQAEVLNSPIGAPFLGYDSSTPEPYPYNPDKAKQLLSDAGYPNGFAIDQWTSNGRYIEDKEVSEAINPMLKNIGIDASLKTADWTTYFGDYVNNGKMPIYLVPQGDSVDPSPYLHQYFQTGVSKRSGFSDPQVDDLLKAEASALDPAQRRVALRQATDAIVAKAPAVFLYIIHDNYGVTNKIDWKPFPGDTTFVWARQTHYR